MQPAVWLDAGYRGGDKGKDGVQKALARIIHEGSGKTLFRSQKTGECKAKGADCLHCRLQT
jgi:hypothetical protein